VKLLVDLSTRLKYRLFFNLPCHIGRGVGYRGKRKLLKQWDPHTCNEM